MADTYATKLRTALEPHVRYYADEADPMVKCDEGGDPLNLIEDDWVLLRDEYSEHNAFVFHPSHRNCANEAWGKEHII